jgi:acetyltransferase-like isoleucine patch superfamily enzyme
MSLSPAITKVGKYSSEAYNITVHCWDGEGKVEIGAFCSIAKNVHIILGGRHNSRALSTYGFGYAHTDVFPIAPPPMFTEKPDVIIGNDVWIGRDVTIMRGVTIGDGAVIAARSHVVRDVNPYEIVGGNPAELIRYRLPEWHIKRLLELKWWDCSDEAIKKIVPLLVIDDIMGVVSIVELEKQRDEEQYGGWNY